VLEGFGLGRGVLWVGAGEGRVVVDVQAAGKKRGGPGVLASPLPLLPGLGSGQRGLGLTRAPSRGMATGLQRDGTVPTVKFDLI
jgi:hypothetical protein